MQTSNLAAAAVVALALATAQAREIPVEDFFRLPQYADMKIAPDGRNLAALAPVNGRQNLVLLDMGARKAEPITSGDAIDVVWFQWINSRRLLLRTATLNERDDSSRAGEYVAIDLDATSPYRLSQRPRDAMSRRDIMGGSVAVTVIRPLLFVRSLPGETDDIIVQEAVLDYQGRWGGGSLFRLNSRTGAQVSLGVGKPESGEHEHWIVDNSGVPRGFTAYRKGAAAAYYRENEQSEWLKVDEYLLASPGTSLLAFDEEAPGLYVAASKGRDTSAIFRWSASKRTFDTVVAAHPQADLTRLRFDEGKVVGVTYDADRRGHAWFDERLARIQKAVDGALPGLVNAISWSRDRTKILILSSSDVSPGSFHLLDLKTGRLEWLADRAPWIKPAEMAPVEALRYKARDGLEIPAYLTVPRGSAGKRLPLVVVVHGGPWVHGADGSFDEEAQFFASRGFAVLQPNFRGSTGYGWKHFSAGFKQWGLAMQDDIADGVQWAIDKGVADKDRVCIYGASYGGYSALMGLVKTPGLYRCGVNYVGVTDIATMLTATWSDFAYSDYVAYLSKDIVGDPSREREALEAVSPVKQAAKIRVPVLMAYGGADRRVPVIHGTMMKSALDAAGRKYEWMEMAGEGHGFRRPENVALFYSAVERFFKEHLKPKDGP